MSWTVVIAAATLTLGVATGVGTMIGTAWVSLANIEDLRGRMAHSEATGADINDRVTRMESQIPFILKTDPRKKQ